MRWVLLTRFAIRTSYEQYEDAYYYNPELKVVIDSVSSQTNTDGRIFLIGFIINKSKNSK